MNNSFALGQGHRLDLDARLLSVDSRKVPLYRFDVLVIGSGAAGSAAALAAAENGAEVALLAKAGAGETNTAYARGGMAAVLGQDDSFDQHVADTLAVGCGLAEADTVRRVVEGGPKAVERLIEWGTRFDQRSGHLDLLREGGHSRPRVLHAQGDATGREIQRAIVTSTAAHPRVTTFSETFVVDLLCAPDGRVVGALVRLAGGDFAVFSAGQTILATGGAGQIYRETTNPTIATGDGLAIAFRAGAALRDLEFYQFHPTLLYIAGAARVLISEIVRGHGGVLRDRYGERFMVACHPDAELAPRDVVSRAVFQRMVSTGDTSVYLDLSGLDSDPHELFPSVSRICHFFGIDIAKDPVPVRPGAHYMIGGVEVDADGRSSVDGLWAVGECASSGLHGANRMGSNSLLECLVLGTHAGAAAAGEARDRGIVEFEVRPPRLRDELPDGMSCNVDDVIYSLKSLMWRQLGVEREREPIEDALAKTALWTRAVSELAPPEPKSWELLNMLLVARLMALSAHVREESRGVHHRNDFPDIEPRWRAHTRITPEFEADRLASARIERAPIRSSAEEVVPTR